MRVAKISLMFSASLFLLAGTWFLVAVPGADVPSARADFNPQLSLLIGLDHEGGYGYVLRTDGAVFEVYGAGDQPIPIWNQIEEMTPPIPVEEIVLWSKKFTVSTNGTVWEYFDTRWRDLGQAPEIPIMRESSSISDLKRRYGDN